MDRLLNEISELNDRLGYAYGRAFPTNNAPNATPEPEEELKVEEWVPLT